MPEGQDPKTYLIEALRHVRVPDYQPDVMKEMTVEAWVLVDSVTSTGPSWSVFTNWWDGREEHERISGRYRVVDPSSGYFLAFVVKPSWSIEDDHPKREPARLSAIDTVA